LVQFGKNVYSTSPLSDTNCLTAPPFTELKFLIAFILYNFKVKCLLAFNASLFETAGFSVCSFDELTISKNVYSISTSISAVSLALPPSTELKFLIAFIL